MRQGFWGGRLFEAMVIGTAAHAIGEALGSLLGMGTSRVRYSDFEHDRLRFVNRADQAMLLEREPPDGAVIGSKR